jgi:hypothetical protein
MNNGRNVSKKGESGVNVNGQETAVIYSGWNVTREPILLDFEFLTAVSCTGSLYFGEGSMFPKDISPHLWRLRVRKGRNPQTHRKASLRNNHRFF